MKKQGSLSIATNSIVTIAVAIIMLALILGFIMHSFGSASDNFLARENAAIQASPASEIVPLTFSPLTPINTGEQFVISLAAFNPRTSTQTVTPLLTCLDTVIVPGSVQVASKSVESRTATSFKLVAKIAATATPGKHSCILAVTGSDGNTLAEQDIVLTVS